MHFSPLAQRAYAHIRANGPLTNQDLIERLGCARRSLYGALQVLQHAGFVERHPDLRDLRRYLYVARP